MLFKIIDKYKKLSLKKRFICGIIMTLLAYILLFVLMQLKIINRYYTGILLSACINIILVVSLNITTGFLGQLTLGHAGFMAVGAYSGAYFTKNIVGLNPIISFSLALIIAGIAAALCGILICLPTLRLKGDYLAIITLAFGEVIKNILLNLDIIGGASGYIGIPRFANFSWAFWLAVLVVVLSFSLIHSRFGRAMISIKEDEIASEASGLNINAYKMIAFIFAAFFAGIAGAIYAHYIGILEPKTFGFDKSIEILVMVVLGGMGNIKGSIIAAFILTILPEALRAVNSLRMFMYAIALIIMMLLKHDGKYKKYLNYINLLIEKIKYLFFKEGVRK